MTNKFAANLRKFILPYTTQIYDYRTIKIFQEAITSSVIIICENSEKKNFSYHLVAERRVLEIPKEGLGNKWVILGTQNVKGKKFSEYFEVRNSVATLCNKAFVLKKYEERDHYYIVENHRIEDTLVKDAVSTKSLNKGAEEIKLFSLIKL